MPKLAQETKDEKELKAQARKVIKILKDKYGTIRCFLTHKNVFELLCAVILSAQCTDDRVNMTTPALFKKYPSADKLAKAKLADVERLIKSCGFYKNKAKNLIAMAQRVVGVYGGEIPDTIEDLTSLGGVGRKTANVILGEWFNKPAGVVVDTHVTRISNLIGLTTKKEPVKIEQDLNAIVSQKDWSQLSLLFIHHGRETCIARRPQCQRCELAKICDYGIKRDK